MKKIILYFAFMVAFTSCSDYIDVNDDQQNNALYQQLPPNKMLAGALTGYASHQNIGMSDFGNRAAYVWGLNTGFTSTEPLYSYQLTSGDYSSLFNNTYLIADNFQDILDKKANFPNYSYHFGIAKVFKVVCMDYLTVLYGDVPYTQAFDDKKFTTPKYDDDKSIIPRLFVELDEARAFFNSPAAGVVSLTAADDVVFGGDTAKWLDFVNTVELRLLMRLTKTTDPALVALRTSRFASLPQSFIAEDVTINPGYNLAINGQWNPIFNTHGLTAARNAWTSTNRANAAGDFVARLLNGQLNNPTLVTTGVVDPRRSRLFTLVGGNIVGNVQGTFPTTAISRYASFYFGRSAADGSADTADKNAAERNGYLMLNAECQFLQAEAIQRGYISGNAEAAFNAGIQASFDFYSTGWGDLTGLVAPVPSTTYLSQIATRQGLGWAATTDKINCIVTQKYIALANWHGIELYIDHMRTGYPVLPLPVGATQSSRPNRLIYPAREYSSNSNNVPNVVSADLFTVNAKTPYYLQ